MIVLQYEKNFVNLSIIYKSSRFSSEIPANSCGNNNGVTYTINTSGSQVSRLELIDLHIKIEAEKRGDIEIDLLSPLGTSSHMLEHRTGESN